MGNSKVLDLAISLHKKYSNDFEGWVRDFINFDGLPLKELTEQQKEIANTLIDKHYLAVAGGGGIGKTALAALLILWFLSTHPNATIPTTAPNGHLLRDVLWTEIPTWIKRCSLKNMFYNTTTRLEIKGFKEWFAVARTVPKDSNKPLNDTLAGFHAENLLIIGDEASGIPDSVFTALDGALTNKNAYILLISNPVSTAGYFYDIISGTLKAGYAVKTYSSKESPLVDDGYAKRIAERYGEESPMYKAKVLGSLIRMEEGVLVTPAMYDKIIGENLLKQEGSIVLGVDVGGDKDKSVICHRVGNSIVKWDVLEHHDNPALIEKIVNEWRFTYQQKHITVVIDAIGKGSGVYSDLKKKGLFDVIGHIGSEKAKAEMTYANKRTEVFDKLKRDFPYLHFPVKPPDRLKKELCNIRYDYNKEKIALEEKNKLKGRLGYSPDHADALSLTEGAEIYVAKNKGFVSGVGQSHSMLRNRGVGKYGKFSKFV